MSIARLLATVRPVHSVWSYQTYLTKNIDDGAMLRRQVAARKPEKSTGRLLRQRPPRVTRSAPARPPLEEIETTEEESVSSFDELEDDEEEEVFDAAEEMPEPEEPHAPAADSAPDTQEAPDESEEEEINEDLLIQLEARRRQAEPRPASSARDTGAPSAPAEAAHDEAGPASAAERDLLTQKLMDLLVRTGWAPEGSEEDEDVFESAAAGGALAAARGHVAVLGERVAARVRAEQGDIPAGGTRPVPAALLGARHLLAGRGPVHAQRRVAARGPGARQGRVALRTGGGRGARRSGARRRVTHAREHPVRAPAHAHAALGARRAAARAPRRQGRGARGALGPRL